MGAFACLVKSCGLPMLGHICCFPSRKTVETLETGRCHPYQKVFSYIVYRCSHARPQVDLTEVDRQHLMRAILSYPVVDLPMSFPRFELSGTRGSNVDRIEKCKVVCRKALL